MTATSPVHLTRLELRHRALALQRRRFWREFSYGAVLVFADVLTLAIVFSILGMLPSDALGPSMGAGGEAFVRGLIPQTAIALGRRVTSLLFCLVVTGSYAHTERQAHPARMAAALLLGLVLPRWVEIWQSALPARWLLLGFVLAAGWVALVLQRRALVEALKSIDPRRLERARTLVVGPQDDVRAVMQDERNVRDPAPAPTFVLSDSWPDGTAESMRELYSALAEWDADAIVLVGAVSDAALQAVMIAASSAGASVYATRRAAFRQLDEPSFVLRRAEPIAVLSRPALVGSQLVVKRFVDLAGAVIGLVVLSPVLVVAAAAVRLTSRGPVFFRQVRVG
ncbi:MAG TPA: sugar transferase, partial [Gemmatimonadaceae bacterium]|nr:sugar transferase [Gemmatimonadaceae bacterium]